MILRDIEFVRESQNGYFSQLKIPVSGSYVKRTNKFIVTFIDGLGPPDTNIFVGGVAEQGSVYQGSRLLDREVVIRIRLNPDHSSGETPADLRQELYPYVQSATKDAPTDIRLYLDPGYETAYVRGYLSRMETTLFQADTQVQLTFKCPDPLIYDSSGVLKTTSAESIVSGDGIEYWGNASVGLRMDMEFQVNWGVNPFYCGMKNTKMYFSEDAGFLSGDLLSIDSRMGSRGVKLTRSGVTTEAMHLLGNLSPGVGLWTYIDAAPGYKEINWSGGTTGDVVLKRLQYPVAWVGI